MSRESNGEIDREAMSGLLAIFGKDNLSRLIDACLEDIDDAIGVILLGSADCVSDTVRRGAHMLAGVLAQYACPHAATHASRVSAQDSQDAVANASDLIAQARRCQKELRIFRNSLPNWSKPHASDNGSI